MSIGHLTRARETLLRWKRDPVAMVREEFKAEPEEWQKEALMMSANPDTQRLAMKACKGPGKTCVQAWIGLNRIATRSELKGAATSITEANIDAGLWPEFAKWMNRSQFFSEAFTWTSSRIANKLEPRNWFIEKRTWPKKANKEEQADALAGIHADNVLFLIDEAGGIPQAVVVTADAVLSSCVDGLVVIGGNPTHKTGPLYRACTTDRALWHVVTITGDPKDPKRSPRISLKWAEEQIKSYGRDNPWVKVNVLGEFPETSINALFGVDDIEKAMSRKLRPEVYSWAEKRLGVDIARFGDDRTIIAPRQGLWAPKPFILRKMDTIDIYNAIRMSHLRWKADIVLVDDSGQWGNGVIDMLTRSHIHALPMRGEEKDSIDPRRYKNLRSGSYFRMAQWTKAGGQLPNRPEFIPEFTEQTYTFVGGVFMMEPKKEIKERLGYSPDYADALAETFTMEDIPADMRKQLGLSPVAARAQTDFDPMVLHPEETAFADHDFSID